MKDSCAVGTLTLIFGLLSTLQGVSTNEDVNTCDSLSCPKGFTCCDNACCPERKVGDPANNHFRVLFIILLVIIELLYICVLVECFCLHYRREQHDVRTGDPQTTREPPSIAPLESVCVSSWDPPLRYSQVVLNPTPTEPHPPYSLRPEGHAGQMRGNAYATL
ncbi:transmembrane protein 92-like [Apodemus sylvaticus]|uniref:transmembrane protein 92-like n=1 Tax=Apodemus sylvaticus TaxID=10129 RepID=UPI00224219EF|nr:transmembrane protein 92-like [Apodemus sylvaticus]